MRSRELEDAESKELLVKTKSYTDSFDQMDVETIVDLSHPSLYKAIGGKERFREAMQKMAAYHKEELKNGRGFRVLKSKL